MIHPNCKDNCIKLPFFLIKSQPFRRPYALARGLTFSYTDDVMDDKRKEFKHRVEDYFIATRPWSFTMSLIITAQLNTVFGLLLILALVLDKMVPL
jgi:hypothetical protein